MKESFYAKSNWLATSDLELCSFIFSVKCGEMRKGMLCIWHCCGSSWPPWMDIGKAGTPINANQIENREYEARSQINRIKTS